MFAHDTGVPSSRMNFAGPRNVAQLLRVSRSHSAQGHRGHFAALTSRTAFFYEWCDRFYFLFAFFQGTSPSIFFLFGRSNVVVSLDLYTRIQNQRGVQKSFQNQTCEQVCLESFRTFISTYMQTCNTKLNRVCNL